MKESKANRACKDANETVALKIQVHSALRGKKKFEESLSYSKVFLSMTIETDRLIYTGGQSVHFRCIFTDLSFKPYQGQGSMEVVDPDGFIVRRWISRSLNLGVLSNSIVLPEYPKIGFWKCIVSAEGQQSEISFKVEKYYTPPLEVGISLPAFIDLRDLKDQELRAEVGASFVTERLSKGSIYLRWIAKEIDGSTPWFNENCNGVEPQKMAWTPLQESFYSYSSLFVNEDIVWVLPFSKIKNTFGKLNNIQVRAEVTYTDYFFNGTQRAFAETKLLPRDIIIQGAHRGFQPGMPLKLTLSVKDSIDENNLSSDKLASGVLSISIEAECEDASLKKLLDMSVGSEAAQSKETYEGDFDLFVFNEHYKSFLETGNYDIILQNTPENSIALRVFATFENGSGDQKAFYNETIEHRGVESDLKMDVTCSTKNVLVGHYIVFHLKTNFHLKDYHWMIMSKDLVLKTGTERVGLQGVHVTSTFSLVVSSEMAPFFQLIVYKLEGQNVISDYVDVKVNPIGNSFTDFQLSQIKDHGMWTVEAACKGVPGSIYMITSIRDKNYENEQGRNFITEERFMQNFENLQIYKDPRNNLLLFESSGHKVKKFVTQTLDDGMEESCNDNYMLSRENRYNDFYDSGDGNWGYRTLNIDHDGEFFVTLDIPESPDDWLFFITTISPNGEITFLKSSFSTERPIDFYCEAPEWIRRGENVGVRCIVHNRMTTNVEVVLKLLGSKDYNFVEVEEFGFVKSFSPRLSHGERHHLIYVRSGESFEVNFPISPIIQSGSLSVEIQMSTQLMLVSQEVTVVIEPEGSAVIRHTSFMLDLKNRGKVYKFAKIVVDESPIIPYEVYRRYIFGSTRGSLTISGDVVGPIFPQARPVSADILFPSGRSFRIPTKGADVHLFNMGVNALQMHYIRLSNQVTKLDNSLISEIFEKMNLEFLGVLRYMSAHGWIKTHDSSDPSVYLTAWALYVFHHAIFQDWEEFIYIDKDILASSIMWLINYQTYRGDFVEYLSFFPLSPWPNFHLTAFVLVALEKTCHILSGKERQICFIARSKAKNILEEQLHMIENVSHLAIVSYALVLSKSDLSAVAYEKLRKKSYSTDGNIYWSRNPIEPNVIRNEFNRPFMEAKICQDQDAEAVLSTSYALLTSLIISGSGIMTEQDSIVKWLNTMRQSSGGFIGFMDTIIALEGLISYSYNSRMKDVTNLKVNIDLPQSNLTEEIRIVSSNIHITHEIDIPNVFGHVNLFAKGSGQAVAQLNVEYGVDFEPFTDKSPKDYFQLNIKEHYFGRNKSEIVIESCFQWLLTNESEFSGPAMLVVDIPTGYLINQPDANVLVHKPVVPEIVDADVTKSGRTIWYFSKIPSERRCFSHTIRRYFPVSNHTRTRQAIIIETRNPERFFIRTFNSTSLHVLSICEVCGSYQCPYCPTFSGKEANTPLIHIVLLLPTFNLFNNIF